MNIIPIACSLTDVELRERREKHLNKIAASLAASEDLDNGIRFQFRIADSTLSDLIEIIKLERECCPFLSFKIAVEAGSKLVSLDLTEPGETRQIVRSLFNWN